MHTSKSFPTTSFPLPVGEEKLHVQVFGPAEAEEAILMVHGSIENGRIFYSKSGRGLAPWLAEQGYRVYVADLRGRGLSQPPVSAASQWGTRESILEDIPALHQKVVEEMNDKPVHWMAHSWGGVLMLATLARLELSIPPASLTTFGTKRHVSIGGARKRFLVDLMWNHVSRLLVRRYGKLPARRFKMGSDDESARSHAETLHWVLEPDWLDPEDGFNYAHALQHKELPPALYLTGKNDLVLGNPTDVQRLMHETGQQNAQFVLVSKENGFLHDYDHINLLTHPDAYKDVYPHVHQWLQLLKEPQAILSQGV